MARAVVLFVVCVAVLGLLVSQAAAGSINDVEHIVIWMQENRAFDHYYGTTQTSVQFCVHNVRDVGCCSWLCCVAFVCFVGTLRGVRGFNDPAAPPLPNGKPVWYQPVVHQVRCCVLLPRPNSPSSSHVTAFDHHLPSAVLPLFFHTATTTRPTRRSCVAAPSATLSGPQQASCSRVPSWALTARLWLKI